MRPDLTYTRQTYQGRDYWVVKDPVTLKFYRFEEEEFALLRMLNGQLSADQIRFQFTNRFAPQKITNAELFQFVGSLYRSSLVISDASGQSIQLRSRGDKNRRQRVRAGLTNVLAIRFRGFDPDGLLTRINRFVGGFFSWPALVVGLMLILSAIGLIFTHFEQFQQKLPAFNDFFAAKNWIWLGITLAVTKIFHELGHGLACKRLGSQCHSMGVMFLVLMPCLYCDVSDSWTLPSKWKRAAIAAAGMYVEFLLASICAFIWWFSQPGMVNMLALNVVFVCSVSTILFNANPLLRYDGYYILSDLIEIPNLRQKASNVLKRSCGRIFLGLQHAEDPFLPKRRRWLFVIYTVLAIAYRWLITLSIFWFLYRLLEPYGMKIIGQAIALMALYGLLGMPLIQLIQFFSVPGRLATVKPKRFGISVAITLIILLAVVFYPIPHHVRCSFVIQPQNAANIYVETPGIARQIPSISNASVNSGEPLLILSSPELEQSIAVLEGEVARAKSRYFATLQQANVSNEAERDIEPALTRYTSLQNQLEQRKRDLEKLNIKSPVGGKVVTASFIRSEDATTGRLDNWYGHPLESRNLGAFLEQGTLVCQVVPDLTRLEAILAIDQADVEFIQSDDPVQLWIRQIPNKMFESAIDMISPQEMKIVPKGLSSRHGGSLITTTDELGREKPQSTTYQVRVPVGDGNGIIAIGSTGVARIQTANQTVGTRIWRLVCRTFRFDL